MNGQPLRPVDLAVAYNCSTFGIRFPDSQFSVGVNGVRATWFLGNDYRSKSGYYGSYPPSYLPRMDKLFPDMEADARLHVFSGALDASTPGFLYDVRHDPQMDAHRLGEYFAELRRFRLVFADPPYTTEDAKRYGTVMVYRKRVVNEIAKVTEVGGHLVWLDTVWPMFTKREWRLWGTVSLYRSTNHRIRGAMLFERVTA